MGTGIIYGHAPYYTIPSYKKLGFEVPGEAFMEVGIPHRRM